MAFEKKWALKAGANMTAGSVEFRVWAPRVRQMNVVMLGKNKETVYPMKKTRDGTFTGRVESAKPGDRYLYLLDSEKRRPDPISRFQPEGVHGPSQVINPEKFKWKDARWKGIDIRDFVIYEFHVGTFTSEGTFEAAIERIGYLKKLGITCVEIMPVAQFPGKRNWGYDGVGLYAAQNSYGGPDGLKKFVDACHRHGVAVCLDVVYNHLGPEGNYLHDYGPYFTSKYNTPWGDAVNYDDYDSAPVRRFVIENALFWVTEYHVDALRLDAIHGIFDQSRKHILAELQEKVQRQAHFLKRKVHVIAESDLNDARIIRSKRRGGYNLDAQWNDDFHHAVHQKLTGESGGYYLDFKGTKDIVKALEKGFVYDGVYSRFRRKNHGAAAEDCGGEKFVIFTQNHDQIGNRAFGDRLSTLISFSAQKLAAALLLFAPSIPLLYMGQEYGEKNPFQYFVDHGDPGLLEAVRNGRRKEFEAFGWKETPDPALTSTYRHSKLNWGARRGKRHAALLKLHADLLTLRRNAGILKKYTKRNMKIYFRESEDGFLILYHGGLGGYFSFKKSLANLPVPLKDKKFHVVWNSEWIKYGGRVRGKGEPLKDQVKLSPENALIGYFK